MSTEGAASWGTTSSRKGCDAEHCQVEGQNAMEFPCRWGGGYFGLEIREGFPEEVLFKLSGQA